MKISNVTNPTGWAGQLAVYVCAFLAGALLWAYLNPTTVNNTQNKAKKGATILSGVVSSEGETDCLEWLKTLSMKDIKKLKKAH